MKLYMECEASRDLLGRKAQPQILLLKLDGQGYDQSQEETAPRVQEPQAMGVKLRLGGGRLRKKALLGMSKVEHMLGER